MRVLLLLALFIMGCENNKLTIATAANFAPFQYIEGSEFKGIDIDIANEIAKELNKELLIKNMEFDFVIQSVSSKNADMAMAGITITETRKKVVDFSDTYFDASQMIIVRENDKRFQGVKTKEELIEKINSIKGIRIGVQTGTTGEFYAKGDPDWGFEGFKNANILSFASGALSVGATINNQIDLVITDEMPARVLSKSNKGAKLLEIPLTDEKYAIALSKGNQKLLDEINAILNKMKTDGRMEKILTKYF